MRWLSRSLIVSPICYCLCLSEKKYIQILKKLKVKNYPDFVTSDSHATVHLFNETKKHRACAIICISDFKNYSLSQVIGLINHECIHIWQEIKLILHENNPSTEFEAYTIQHLTQSVISELLKSKKGKALLRREIS